MLVMLSLVFGSAAFAGPPEGKGMGAEMSIKALTNHAGDHSQGMKNADGNAAFMSGSSETGDGSGDGSGDSAPTCSVDTPEVCDGTSCPFSGGVWWDGECFF